MIYYSYNDFITDIKTILPTLSYNDFDAIVSIARGGSTLSHFLCEALNIRKLYSINSISYNETTKLNSIDIFNIPDLSDDKKVLIVDDICDSGRTLDTIMNIFNQKYSKTTFKSMTIFYKPTASYIPDFKIKEANDWIDFFWASDLRLE